MDLSLKEIRAFNATIQQGNFTRAAEQLNVSQPAITAQIRKLEERFDYPLLERFSRGVRATEFGKQLYALTSQYQDLDQALDVLANPYDQPSQMTLRVASASSLIFMPLIAEFNQKYPNVALKIRSASTEECQDMVLSREVDIGLFPYREHDNRFSRLEFTRHRLVAVIPKDHELLQQTSISIELLVNNPLIVYKPQTCTQKIFCDLMETKGLSFNANVVVDGRLDMCEAVAYGLGIGFALEKDLNKDPRLQTLPITECTESFIDEHVVWLKNRSALPGMREFLELAFQRKGKFE